MSRARVLYEFQGDGQSLTVYEGEILIIHNDEGDGWLDAETNGVRGLVPATYVEMINDDPDRGSTEVGDSFMINNGSDGTSEDRHSLDLRLDEEDVIPEDELVIVHEGWLWEESESFDVTVSSPQKMKKGSFSKAYISYEICAIPGPTGVSRRFNQFFWLYKTLTSMYPLLIIPQLPDKQRSGRFEEEFIEQRRIKLEQFMNRLARHPILRKSDPIKVFLTSETDKDFEAGKKRVEKESKNFNFLRRIKYEPETRIIDDDATAHIELFRRMLGNFEAEVSSLSVAADLMMKQHEVMSNSVLALSSTVMALSGKGENSHPSCWRKDCGCAPLAEGFEVLSTKAKQISDEYTIQRYSIETLITELAEYIKYAQCFIPLIRQRDSVASVYHTQSSKLIRNANPSEDDRVKIDRLKNRLDRVTYAVLCEQEIFHQQKLDDLKKYFGKFVESQARFHGRISDMWKEVVPSFNAVKSVTGDHSIG